MPDSSNSHQPAVCSETMSNNNSSGDSNKKSSSVQIDLGEVTQHNIKVLKKVNQVKKIMFQRLGSGQLANNRKTMSGRITQYFLPL